MSETSDRVLVVTGASGYLAGRAIWKESVPISATERTRFLAEVGALRIQRLNDITAEYGRPWSEFYDPLPADEVGWYTRYAIK